MFRSLGPIYKGACFPECAKWDALVHFQLSEDRKYNLVN